MIIRRGDLENSMTVGVNASYHQVGYRIGHTLIIGLPESSEK